MASSGNENGNITTTLTAPVEKCLFCGIIKENEPGKIVFQDEEIVAFADIKPASKAHFLIVPKKHIVDVKQLASEDKSLVEKLVAIGKSVLEQHGGDLNDVRFGFHWPPFHTVSHLHLHAISPVREMTFMGKLIFKQDSYWFVSPEYVLSRL